MGVRKCVGTCVNECVCKCKCVCACACEVVYACEKSKCENEGKGNAWMKLDF
jgi:hypothetical protein